MSKISVRIETSEMKRALDVAGSVINRKNALPILGCVVFRYNRERKTFEMLASNSEQFLRMDCQTRQKDGTQEPWLILIEDDRKEPLQEFAVSHQQLREAIGGLPTMPCMATIDTDKATIEVDYQTGRFSIPIETGAAEFPQMPAVAMTKEENPQQPPVVVMTTEAQPLIQVMQQAVTCAASDELRLVMNTVCLDLFHDKMVIVASDGHSLFRQVRDTGVGYLTLADFEATSRATVLVPKQVLPTLAKAFASAGQLTLAADGHRAQFQADGLTLVTVCIDGHYPNYSGVIPQNNPHCIILGRQELTAALRRVGMFASDSSNMVTLKRDGAFIILSGEDMDFSRAARERVALLNEAETSLPDGFQIGCKCATMLALLPLIQTDAVRFHLSDPSRAMLLQPDDDNSGLTLLQMPMLINEA